MDAAKENFLNTPIPPPPILVLNNVIVLILIIPSYHLGTICHSFSRDDEIKIKINKKWPPSETRFYEVNFYLPAHFITECSELNALNEFIKGIRYQGYDAWFG